MTPQDELVDLLARLVGTLRTQDVVEDPEMSGLLSQLVQVLNPKAAPLPIDLLEKLAAIENAMDRFKLAAETINASDPEKLKQLADSLREAGLLKGETVELIEQGVHEAMLEVMSKSESQIEHESAIKWASRAAACYELAKTSTDLKLRIRWLMRAEDMRHEAIEHGALAKDHCDTLTMVEESLKPYKALVNEVTK